MTAGCAVIVFAKAPVPGTVKTRLAARLGADGAARLAERMLLETATQAVDAAIGPVEICCAPERNHPAFLRLLAGLPVGLSDQGVGDLGERMHRAFARVLVGHDRALVIGTDAPGVDAAYLRDAARQLATRDVVIGPALDGGYSLIGLRRPAAGLFEGIAWSSPQVLTQTRAAVQRLGLAHVELAALADIDEPADLRHLPAAWQPAFLS